MRTYNLSDEEMLSYLIKIYYEIEYAFWHIQKTGVPDAHFAKIMGKAQGLCKFLEIEFGEENV